MTTHRVENPVILLDMDEVLTDFVGAACKIHGVSKEDLEQHWNPGEWSITKPMNRLKGNDVINLTDYDMEKFLWKPINNNSEFWASKASLDWAHL